MSAATFDPVVSVVEGSPFAQYMAVEAFSSSGAKKLLRSPAHFLAERNRPSAPTEAMQFGTAVHTGVLEPERFGDEVLISPEFNRRTKDGRAESAAFAAENAGRIILAPDDFGRARKCIDAVRAHPAASVLLAGAQSEISLYWHDEQYGIACKARLDIFNRGGITDLKTAQDASPDAFARSVASFLYHLQGAHYLDGAEHAMNETPRFFAFIAVESEEPHAVGVYALGTPSILAGKHLLSIAAERYAAAIASGKWPAYPDTIEMLNVPAWALKFDR